MGSEFIATKEDIVAMKLTRDEARALMPAPETDANETALEYFREECFRQIAEAASQRKEFIIFNIPAIHMTIRNYNAGDVLKALYNELSDLQYQLCGTEESGTIFIGWFKEDATLINTLAAGAMKEAEL